MAQKDIKKLNPTEIKKQVKKLDEKKDFKVMIGDTEYKLQHDVVFRKTKQQKVLEDMLVFFNSIKEDNISLLEMASPYTALLIIKHFTNLDVSDDFEESIELLNALIDLEALGAIISELPEGEVLKIYELLTKTVDNIKANIEEAEAEMELIAPQIENEQVKEMIEDNGNISV